MLSPIYVLSHTTRTLFRYGLIYLYLELTLLLALFFMSQFFDIN